MRLFVTERRRILMLRAALEGLAEWVDQRLATGDLDFDDNLHRYGDAAKALLEAFPEPPR